MRAVASAFASILSACCVYMHVGGDGALVNQIVFIIYIYAYIPYDGMFAFRAYIYIHTQVRRRVRTKRIFFYPLPSFCRIYIYICHPGSVSPLPPRYYLIAAAAHPPPRRSVVYMRRARRRRNDNVFVYVVQCITTWTKKNAERARPTTDYL